MSSKNLTHWWGIFPKPTTKLGRWSVVLALAYVLFRFMWSILPGGASLSFVCGLLAGIFAMIAINRNQERSWLVYLTILPSVSVLIFFAAELLVPH